MQAILYLITFITLHLVLIFIILSLIPLHLVLIFIILTSSNEIYYYYLLIESFIEFTDISNYNLKYSLFDLYYFSAVNFTDGLCETGSDINNTNDNTEDSSSTDGYVSDSNRSESPLPAEEEAYVSEDESISGESPLPQNNSDQNNNSFDNVLQDNPDLEGDISESEFQDSSYGDSPSEDSSDGESEDNSSSDSE